MPSLIQPYEYDIFISYRHKDNKYDGWVSDFVANLKRELEATFKDEVSVYFDENPHDGLLESHNVGKSLEGKLKCLILIPIISQTYCDTKSFAWQHEFCAFNRIGKEDPFGRDIKLANGNVASRILPIKIHDLDAEDKSMLESELGGVLRCVEFIYNYRDQINKVANAVKEIIVAMGNPASTHQAVSSSSIRVETKNLDGSRKKRKILAITSLCLLLAALTFYIVYYFFIYRPDKSIAVIPFTDLSQEHDQEYFCDGMTEEILNHLSKIRDLRVISRTSCMKYKGAKISVNEIARELGVTNILEGSIRRSGDQVRVTVQLIDASSDEHLWSEDYDFLELKDIFSVQTDVSTRVAGVLKAKLTTQEKGTLSKTNTENPEAYKLYLKGRFYWAKRTPQSYDSAEQYYKRAITLDPEYALAYSGLADCYTLGLQGMTMVEEIPIAKAYLTKAISLDSNLSEALTTMGFIQSHFDYDWASAKSTLQKAILLNPNYPIAHLYYGNIFIFTGDIEQGLIEVKKAVDLDPLSSSVNWALGSRYYLTNKTDLAITQFQKTLTLDPENNAAKLWLGLSFLRKGFYDQAIDTFGKLPRNTLQQLDNYKILISLVHAQNGESARAKSELNEISKGEGIQSNDISRLFFLTLLYISLENYDAALTQLERAYEIRSLNIIGLKIDPIFDPIRNQPRFKALLKKMNFE